MLILIQLIISIVVASVILLIVFYRYSAFALFERLWSQQSTLYPTDSTNESKQNIFFIIF